MAKVRVGVLFGGRSGEHEVSLRSATSILDAIDRERYDVLPIGIAKSGKWLSGDAAQALLHGKYVEALAEAAANRLSTGDDALQAGPPTLDATQLDVVFPVLHGTFGEDGTIQGMLELADVAYVGSGVLGSAVGMDKAAMKVMFAAAGLPLVKHVTVLRGEWKSRPHDVTAEIETSLAYPVFVKPANLGSSVGISKVRRRGELAAAMDEAAQFDRKIVIEEGVGGAGSTRMGKARELEIAVLGNDAPEASVVGEIVPDREFYDYQSKYDATSTSEPQIPATLTAGEAHAMREMAIRAFQACDCAGLARVDFLMEAADPEGKNTAKIYLNEVNTMPGFTSISMYPKLWEASGVGYRELIDRLIALAMARHAEKKQTRFSM